MKLCEIIELGKLQHKCNVSKGFHETDVPISRVLVLIHGEVSEALECLRKPFEKSEKIPEYTSYQEELSDVFLRIVAMAANYGKIDEIEVPYLDNKKLRVMSDEEFLMEIHQDITWFYMTNAWPWLWKILYMLNEREPDILSIARAKYEYNLTRPYKHGKKY